MRYANSRSFVKTVDIWSLPLPAMVKCLQVGQWVSAGTPDETRSNCGRFYGVTTSGSVVVAWNGNARNAGNVRQYQRTQYLYAQSRKGVR